MAIAADRGRVAHDAGHERVGELAPALAPLVVGVAEEVRLGREIGDAHVEVVTGTPTRRVRLGHEGGDESRFLGGLLHHQPEERELVGHLERGRVVEVELVLTVAAFAVEAEEPEARLGQVARHRLEERHGVELGLDVVGLRRLELGAARHGLEVAVGAVERLRREHVELGLDTEVHHVTHLGGRVELLLQMERVQCANGSRPPKLRSAAIHTKRLSHGMTRSVAMSGTATHSSSFGVIWPRSPIPRGV